MRKIVLPQSLIKQKIKVGERKPNRDQIGIEEFKNENKFINRGD